MTGRDCRGHMEVPSDHAGYHPARGGGKATQGCASLAPGLCARLTATSRDALEGLYRACGEHGPRHQFLVAADHEAGLCHRTLALVADTTQCVAPHAMNPPREGCEGQQYSQSPAAPLIAQYVELGGSEFVYLDRPVGVVGRHWTAQHLPSPNVQLTLDPLDLPTLECSSPKWTRRLDTAVRTLRMAPGGQRTVWPGAEDLLTVPRVAQARQPATIRKHCGVCALLSTVGILLRVPRPGTLVTRLDRRWMAAVVLKRDIGPVVRLPSLGELPAEALNVLPAPRPPLPVADLGHKAGLPD